MRTHNASCHGQVSGHKCITMLASGINRNALREKIFAAGVELARRVYEQPLHTQPVLGGLNVADSFAVADDFAARHLCRIALRVPRRPGRRRTSRCSRCSRLPDSVMRQVMSAVL
ncbi:hypothetical protein [Nocardia sp. NPDC049707]|uniref:hypothetical protein n=1 Tax=Nocardia sp. NPDC049707 TaxID=3154735 RepID=UPI00342B3C98